MLVKFFEQSHHELAYGGFVPTYENKLYTYEKKIGDEQYQSGTYHDGGFIPAITSWCMGDAWA